MDTMKAKYVYLLDDNDVRRWFENLETKSLITASVCLRALGFHCNLNRTTPKKILEVANSKSFRDGFTERVCYAKSLQ